MGSNRDGSVRGLTFKYQASASGNLETKRRTSSRYVTL